ncbi:DUF805 domain-containing protein [Agromyces aureus]|uniref:DUF805 domain-containing protein n=1 Tax=Agromyces aureus TaxID=453304 RepID=A0A191WBD7_9MICO|nr:DUF805 domain-containing protein [Agromyces aureus]ANJ25570.1 hypothetical protein ATC03_01055 [Agromyces aureus]
MTAFAPPHQTPVAQAARLDLPLYGATFGQSVSRFFRNYARFSGRASRSEFWWAYLFQSIIGFVLGTLLGIVLMIAMLAVFASAVQGNTETLGAFGIPQVTIDVVVAIGVPTIVSLVLLLPLLVPSIAVTVRRLHDTNRSGWWYLLSLVPVGGYVVLVFAILEPDPAGARFDVR